MHAPFGAHLLNPHDLRSVDCNPLPNGVPRASCSAGGECMKAITILGIIPLFACWMYAQTEQSTSTTTTTVSGTTYEGTLIDESCHNTRTEHHESSTTSNP